MQKVQYMVRSCLINDCKKKKSQMENEYILSIAWYKKCIFEYFSKTSHCSKIQILS